MELNETRASLPTPLSSPVIRGRVWADLHLPFWPCFCSSASMGFKLGVIVVSLRAIMRFCQIILT